MDSISLLKKLNSAFSWKCMMDIITNGIIPILIVCFCAMLVWYWIRTIIIMGRKSFFLGVLGFFLSPYAQIVFYLSNKKKLGLEEKKDFSRFWWTVLITIITGIGMVIIQKL